jgi:WD40 repeat protein
MPSLAVDGTEQQSHQLGCLSDTEWCDAPSVRSAAFSTDGTTSIWDAERVRLVLCRVHCMRSEHVRVRSVTFSSDDKRDISGSSDDLVKIWDVEVDHTLSYHQCAYSLHSSATRLGPIASSSLCPFGLSR